MCFGDIDFSRKKVVLSPMTFSKDRTIFAAACASTRESPGKCSSSVEIEGAHKRRTKGQEAEGKAAVIRRSVPAFLHGAPRDVVSNSRSRDQLREVMERTRECGARCTKYETRNPAAANLRGFERGFGPQKWPEVGEDGSSRNRRVDPQCCGT